MPGMNEGTAQIESSVLLPALCVILVLVIIASVAISVQKHKRY